MVHSLGGEAKYICGNRSQKNSGYLQGLGVNKSGHERNFLKVMDMLYDFTEMVVIRAYSSMQTYHTLHVRYMYVTVYNFYLIKQKSKVS